MLARINWSILILLLLEVANASLQENNPLLFRDDRKIFDQEHSSNTTLRRSRDTEEKSTSFLHSNETAEERYRLYISTLVQKNRLIEKCGLILHGCTDLLVVGDMNNSDITIIKFRNITEFNLEQRRKWNEFLQEFQGNLSNILFLYNSRHRNQVSELQIIKYLIASFSVMCQTVANRALFYHLHDLVHSSSQRILNPGVAKDVSKNLETFLIKYETNFHDAQNSVEILHNFYNKKINYEIDIFLRLSCFDKEILSEFLENEGKINNLLLNTISLCRIAVIFHNVVEPILFVFLFVGNMMGSGTLLFIFARHKDERTSNNIMIFNLAINNVLSVTIGVPLSYIITFYPQYNVNDNGRVNLLAAVATASIRLLFFMVSAMSILALSVQRYLAIARPLLMSRCCISDRTVAIMYMLSVWAFAFVIYGTWITIYYYALTSSLTVKSIVIVSRIHIGISVVTFIIVSIIVSVLTILTSRRLKQSLRELPGEGNLQSLHKMRNRGPKVPIFLAIAFSVSFFFPFLFTVLIITYPELHENLANMFVMNRITSYLFYISFFIYPLALYMSSNTYKSLYNKYLFRCCKSDKVQNEVVVERPRRNENDTCL